MAELVIFTNRVSFNQMVMARARFTQSSESRLLTFNDNDDTQQKRLRQGTRTKHMRQEIQVKERRSQPASSGARFVRKWRITR